jgi:hypothetical protein
LVDKVEAIPRRKFLTLAAGAGVTGAAILGQPLLALGAASDSVDLAKATHAVFFPHVGSVFTVYPKGGDPVKLTLIAAVELPEPTIKGQKTKHKPKRVAFSLLFRGPAKPRLKQGTYEVRHGTVGKIDMLFLVYVGPDKDKNSLYEAIFN